MPLPIINPLSMCRGKKRFPTRAKARQSCATIRKHSKAERMHPYFCHFCKQFHIGHAMEREERETMRVPRRPAYVECEEMLYAD